MTQKEASTTSLPDQARHVETLQQQLMDAQEELAQRTALRAAAQQSREARLKEQLKEARENNPDYQDLLEAERNLKKQEPVVQLGENGKAKRELSKELKEELEAGFDAQDDDANATIQAAQEEVERLAMELDVRREQVIRELATQ